MTTMGQHGHPKNPNAGAPPFINDMPRKELAAIQAAVPEVQIRIRRKSGQGSFVMVPPQLRPVEQLLNGAWDMEVMEKAGGGVYEFTAVDPATNEPLAPVWRQTYPGSPKMDPFKDPSHLGYTPLGYTAPAGAGAPVGFTPFGAPAGLGAPLAGFGGMPGVAPPTVFAGIPVPAWAWTTPGIATPVPGPDGRPMPPPPGSVPPQAMMLPVEVQWGIYYQQAQAQQRPGSYGVDGRISGWADRFDTRSQMESAENKTLRDQIAELKAANERIAAGAETRALAAQLAALQTQLAQSQQGGGAQAHVQLELARMQQQAQMAAAAQQAAAQQQAQQQQMQMLMMMMESRNAQKGPDWGPILAGLGAVVGPLVTAYFSNASQRSTTEVQAQMKQMELSAQNNTTLVQTLLAASNQPKGDSTAATITAVLGAISPIVGPLLLQWLENRSPETMLAVQQGTVQGQMMMTKMVTEFIDQMTKDQGGERPWWAPMLEGLVNGVQDAAPLLAHMVQSRGQQPALPPPQRQPQPQSPSGATQPTQAPESAQYAPMSWEALEQVDPQVAAIVKQVYGILPTSLGFHTNEWRILLFNFHRRVEPETMADLLLTHLENCKNFGTLPTVLDKIEENPETIRPFLMQLPIGRQDPEYAKAVVDLVVGAIQGDDEPKKPPVVTPAPAAAPQQPTQATPPAAPTTTETAA